MQFDHETFLSPFTWRYGSKEMRQIWSEHHKRRLMRQVWVALATAQHEAGLVTAVQLAELQQAADRIDLARAQQIEQETRHDVMAEIRAFAEQCPTAGGIIHLGATSADITDNVDVLRIREAAVLLAERLHTLLLQLAERIEETAELPVMAFTHIQPAEPTTLGYRLAVYAQDLLENWHDLQHIIHHLRGKGFKGAVGTQASYAELLRETSLTPLEMEAIAMRQLNLEPFPIATQTYTRQQDLKVVHCLARVAASLHKFALDFRLLQSPLAGEWAEPFGKGQVGSSAMPFKRNPIHTENICSLARYVAALPDVLWQNAAQAVLERSLDDSANRRVVLAEAFLATDELLRRAERVIRGMSLDERAMARTMARYGPFAATERLLMALVKAGADRQEAHEWIREASLAAWRALQVGDENPLGSLLAEDERIGRFLSPAEVLALLDADGYTGTAVFRARFLAQAVREAVAGEL